VSDSQILVNFLPLIKFHIKTHMFSQIQMLFLEFSSDSKKLLFKIPFWEQNFNLSQKFSESSSNFLSKSIGGSKILFHFLKFSLPSIQIHIEIITETQILDSIVFSITHGIIFSLTYLTFSYTHSFTHSVTLTHSLTYPLTDHFLYGFWYWLIEWVSEWVSECLSEWLREW